MWRGPPSYVTIFYLRLADALQGSGLGEEVGQVPGNEHPHQV